MKKWLCVAVVMFLLGALFVNAQDGGSKDRTKGQNGFLQEKIIQEPVWVDFQKTLQNEIDSTYTEFKKSDKFPKFSVDIRQVNRRENTTILGRVTAKTGDYRSSPIYVILNQDVTDENKDSELKKAKDAVVKFCEEAVAAEKNGQLLTKEQTEYKPSPEDKAVANLFANKAQELMDKTQPQWPMTRSQLEGPGSSPFVVDGKKYIIVYLVIRDSWGLANIFVVARYPIEEISEETVEQKVQDAFSKITDFLTKNRTQGKQPNPPGF